MRKSTTLTAAALTGTIAFALAAPAAAQDASPVPGAAMAVCAAEPRDVEELIGFYFSPEGTPLATPTMATVDAESALPSGDPADAETVAAVSAVIIEMFACFGEQQYARAFSLMTDDLARQFGPDVADPSEDTPDEVRALLETQLAATPSPAGVQAAIEPARDVRVLSEGRVGGVWQIDGDAVFVVFERQDDRWLLDEVVDILEEEGATPTP
jgi:hypothetical protein